MKNIKSRLLLAFAPIFFVGGFVFFIPGVQAANDCGTAAFQPDWRCTDVTASNNVFDASAACVTGHCDGGSNMQCCRQNCDSGETCQAPAAGLVCTARGVCSGSRQCCSGTATAAPVTTTAAGTNTAATASTAAPACPTCFSNPLAFSTVDAFLTTIMGALQKIIVTLSLVMIVLGAVLYVTSGGGKQIETAKGMITAALVGMAIGIAAPSFLKEIAIIIGWGGVTDATVIAAPTISQIAINVLNFLLGVLGILSLVMLVIGATMYLTSAGDEGRIDTGKNIFKSALLGVVIAMASMVILTQIAQFFVVAPQTTTASQVSPTVGGTLNR